MTEPCCKTTPFLRVCALPTKLANRQPPAIAHYRRIQAAAYLLQTTGLRYEQLQFTSGQLTDFGLPRAQWQALLAGGEAFRTSGCPGCNRPFYNERPGGTMYNYPTALSSRQEQQAIAELEL